VRATVIWLVAAGVLAAGCTSHDEAEGSSRTADHPARVSDDCSSRIDAQITARIIPNADREYAGSMCRAKR
jgi:hypothetical protein